MARNTGTECSFVLTTVGDGDGELLVAVSTVGPHPTDDVDHTLLRWSGPGQGTFHGLRVGSDTGQIVLGRHRDHVMVGRPHKVDDIAWWWGEGDGNILFWGFYFLPGATQTSFSVIP